jgi:peptide/nickel transport system substrate-binding protein
MSQMRLAVVVIVGLLVSPEIAQAGGTFRYSLDQDIDHVDPALAYNAVSWEIEYATCSMLMSYPDAPAPRGSRLVPDAAAAMPQVSRDGKTYTFRLRQNRRFSDGSRITPRSFKHALTRVLNREMRSPGHPFFMDIVGARAFVDHTARTVVGITVLSGNRLRIRLKRRAPDLLARLAMPFACPVKLDTPTYSGGVRTPFVGSGPYYIAERVSKRSVVLRRNRFYRGPRPHHVSEIAYDIGLPLSTIRLNIEEGKTDHGPVPASAHAQLGPRYGVRRRSPGRYFVNPRATLRYLTMNHERALFGKPGGGENAQLGNVPLKQAVNYAIDRTALIEQRGAYAGGITDQHLPRAIPGFRDARIYPSRPDLARARALAAGNTRSGQGVFYSCNTGPCLPMAQIIQANLEAIGVDMDIRAFPRCLGCERKTHTRGEPFDMSMELWSVDYFDPQDFMFLLDGRTLRPRDNTNLSYFDSSEYNKRFAQASTMIGQARYRAFGSLDVNVAMNVAPIAAFMNDNDRRFFSAHVRNFFQHPVYGLDLPAIAVE